MSYYGIGINSKYDTINKIDDEVIKNNLIEIYGEEFLKDEDLIIMNIIKDKDIVNEHLAKFKLNVHEYIASLARLYPHLFKHHLIKFIKKTYLKK